MKGPISRALGVGGAAALACLACCVVELGLLGGLGGLTVGVELSEFARIGALLTIPAVAIAVVIGIRHRRRRRRPSGPVALGLPRARLEWESTEGR